MGEAGFEIRVIPADIDESVLPGEGPFELVERLARAKAQAVARQHAELDEPVIAADTIVALDGELLGKPAGKADARRMLHSLSGKTHQVATGVCIARGDSVNSFVDITDVTFYELTDAVLTAGYPLGVSNEYAEGSDCITISTQKGALVVVETVPDGPIPS